MDGIKRPTKIRSKTSKPIKVSTSHIAKSVSHVETTSTVPIWHRLYTKAISYYNSLPPITRIIALSIISIVLLVAIYQLIFVRDNSEAYNLGSAELLLPEKSEKLGEVLDHQSGDSIFNYNEGYVPTPGNVMGNVNGPKFSAKISDDRSGAIEVTDVVNDLTIIIKPEFDVLPAMQDENRLVMPLRGKDAALVYTLGAINVKEDIILKQYIDDELSFDYKLVLPNESLEARMENDGSVGIYGPSDSFLSGDVSTASDEDAALLAKARASAEKNKLIFRIPAPFIIEPNQGKGEARTWYSLEEDILTVHAANLDKAIYPLSIDPSVYIETASKLMRGNNETNVDFNVTNELILKGATTGARFDEWTTTLGLNEGRSFGSAVVAGGYIYYIGGSAEGGVVDNEYTTAGSTTYTVPAGVTSVSIKSWGGGGGGGGASPDRIGGNGGGGGYASATISVTPSEDLTVYVGGGGAGGTGFSTGTDSGNGGGGGGYSGVYRSTTPLLVAGAGGGGGGGNGDTGSTARQPGTNAGAGGGSTGGTGVTSGTTTGGSGGTASAGGGGGTVGGAAGASLQGGDGGSGVGSYGSAATNGGGRGGVQQNGGGPNKKPGGGGGGAGYYGGGGGGYRNSQYDGGAGGGGGSSYLTGSPSTTAAGAGLSPGNSSDPDRGTAGAGGAGGATGSTGTNGNAGKVIISYATGGAGAVKKSVYWAKLNDTSGAIESPNPGNGACTGWCTSTDYDLPNERQGHASVAYNGYIYVFGGEDDSGTKQSTVYIAKLGANGEPSLWHPTDTNPDNWVYWYSDTAMSSARSFLSATAYNNRIYLSGGDTSGGAINTVQYAEIKPNGTLGSLTSTGMSSLPTVRFGHTTHIYNDYMYLVGGYNDSALLDTVYYTKLNSDGTMNSWVQTTSFTTARMTWGGNYSTIYGGYLYLSGGCTALDVNGYCSTVAGDTQLASINADGSISDWGSIANLTSLRIGHGLVAWRDAIYGIGGCNSQSAINGQCTDLITVNSYGNINQDGDASTVSDSVTIGTGLCSGADPYDCDLPPLGDGNGQGGQMAGGTVINNGYIYYIGGCREVSGSQICYNGGATRVSDTIYYAQIASDGTLRRPATCTGSGIQYAGSWCVDNSHTINSGTGLAAFGYTVFNNTVYAIGGTTGPAWQSNVYYTTFNADGSLNTWSSQTFSNVGLGSARGYMYVFARANPSTASTFPGNLYVLGGCDGTGAGLDCDGTEYTTVYKCKISTSGSLGTGTDVCTTTGQLQIDSEPLTGGSQGLGIMAGAVYANYVYLIGGQSPNEAERGQIMYAKIDNSNNIVAASGSIWQTSPNEIDPARRRGIAFGYNGYLYGMAGFASDTGLNDLLFAKIDVSDGSIGPFTTSSVTIIQRWDLRAVVSSGYVYTLGGCSSGEPPATCNSMLDTVQTFQLYNNYSGSPTNYTTETDLFTTDRLGASATVLNGYIYLAGGCDSAASTTDCTAVLDDVRYAQLNADGSIGSWAKTTGDLPANRAWGQLETAGGSLYWIGGQSHDATAERDDVYYARPGYQAITQVQKQTATCYDTDGDCTATATITAATAGNTLIGVCTGEGNTGWSGVSMTGFTSAIGETTNALMGQEIFYKTAAGGETSISCNSTGTGTTITGFLTVFEYSGLAATPVIETASDTGASSSPSTGTTATLSQADALLVAGLSMDEQSISFSAWTNGFTEESDQQRVNPGGGGVGVATKIVSAQQTYSTEATPTSAADWIGQIVAFKAATNSGPDISVWRTATNILPDNRTKIGAAVWNDRIYVVGGLDGSAAETSTVYVSPQLSSGGDITSAWTTTTAFNVARSGATVVAYANNLYLFGGMSGTNYFNDGQYTQINSDGTLDSWSYTTSLPQKIANADGFAANGYMYILGGRSAATTCTGNTYIAPISANTTIATGNNPTGIGEWYQTRETMNGAVRYGLAAVYNEGRAYVLGGGCGSTITWTVANRVQYATLLSQPQVAKYSRMIDTDTNVFPSKWLLNGLDNDIGARWNLSYRSSTAEANSWGQDTNFGNVTLGQPETYTPIDGTGTNTNYSRYHYLYITIDSSQSYGYPDDVARGPTIDDLSLFFDADPNKRLRHGKTFTGGEKQPLATPF